MSRLARIACDSMLAVLATLSAIFLRTDLVVQWPDLAASLPYLLTTAATATVFVGASGLDLGFWRFASLSDIMRVIGVSVAVTVATVAIVFAFNRLEGVARAIPFLQAVLIATFLMAPRLLWRARFAMRKRNPVPAMIPAWSQPIENVLVVGANSLAEVFLRALLESGATHVKVAGVVSARRRHVGRFLRQYRILGTFDEIDRIIAEQAVHGVYVRRVILAVPPDTLPPHAREALAQLEAEQGVALDPLAARLAGPYPAAGGAVRPEAASPAGAPGAARRPESLARTPVAAFRQSDLESLARAPYWRWKRTADVVVTAAAGLLLLPVGSLALVLVTIDLGWPPIFWQERLGLGGTSFRLYKFRTMAPAHDHGGALIPDEDRLSVIGRLLRRSRLDELPQLWNVLAGDMALTGPRPLLPMDQPEGVPNRLVVRPGLTGWAQVQGGRTIGPVEKAALDLWWIRHASVALDLRILAGTVRMTVLGDRVNDRAVAEALAGSPDA